MIRPGLAKTRGLPLVRVRRKVALQTFERTWQELFACADVVSEGSPRQEQVGRVWYGSTSVILPTGEGDTALLVALGRRDVHLRLRAVRMAHREACSRAPSRLGRLTAEIHVSESPRGVRIDVDVQAPLIEGRVRTRRTATSSPWT